MRCPCGARNLEIRLSPSPGAWEAIDTLHDMTKASSGGTAFWISFALAAAAGVAVEIGVGQMEHRREAWDSGAYWTFGLPLMILTTLVCGFIARQSPFLLGYAPFVAQLLTMLVKTGGGSMLPLGVALMGVVGLSGAMAAFVGAALGRWVLGTRSVAEKP